MSKKKAQIEIKAGWEQKLITSSRLAHYQKQNLDSLVNNMDLTKVFNPLRIYKTNWLDKAYKRVVKRVVLVLVIAAVSNNNK